MCRFVVYMGPPITLDMLITRPEYSIIHQSFKSRLREEPLNGDGFGVAWYAPKVSEVPAVFRSIRPAWNNRNLLDLSRVTKSGVILAHVRAATRGSAVAEANCHPFATGSLAFMHNGALAEFPRLKRTIQQRLSDEAFTSIQGTTDSEHVFALFQDHYTNLADRQPSDRLADALLATIAEAAELTRQSGATRSSSLNIAVTDGLSTVVSRFSTGDGEGPSLFVTTGKRFVCTNGSVHMSSPGASHSTVIIASEPLNDDPDWQRVPSKHLLIVSPDHAVSTVPIDLTPVAESPGGS